MSVPPELRPFIPSGFTLRALMTTKMAPTGEKVFLYDNAESVFPEARLRALRDGKEFALFDGVIMAVDGLRPIAISDGRQLLAFAYSRAGDGADTRFVIFSFEDNGYSSIFERVTTQGRMRMLSNSPLRFEIWSADETGESCVWCAHRYNVTTYELKGNNFDVVAMRTTDKALDPSDIADEPFVVVGPHSKPAGRPR